MSPHQSDIDNLVLVLDATKNFESNDQRARYILTSNWMRDRGRDAQKRAEEIYRDVMSREPKGAGHE